MPLALKGGENWRTRLLKVSATHRLPEPSKARPEGRFISDWVVAEPFDVKLDCPRTSDAFMPLIRPPEYRSTRLALRSATQTLPAPSTATAPGPNNPA